MRPLSIPAGIAPACITFLILAACSPRYNWREVHGTPIPYTVMLPAKPSSVSRPINLDGVQVNMSMTAAEVDGVTFAVGTAVLPDATAAQRALPSMKTALVKNIGGSVKHEKISAPAPGTTMIELEAAGASGGQRRLLVGRFVAKGPHVYQAIAVGGEQAFPREAAETFLTSFKPD